MQPSASSLLPPALLLPIRLSSHRSSGTTVPCDSATLSPALPALAAYRPLLSPSVHSSLLHTPATLTRVCMKQPLPKKNPPRPLTPPVLFSFPVCSQHMHISITLSVPLLATSCSTLPAVPGPEHSMSLRPTAPSEPCPYIVSAAPHPPPLRSFLISLCISSSPPSAPLLTTKLLHPSKLLAANGIRFVKTVIALPPRHSLKHILPIATLISRPSRVPVKTAAYASHPYMPRLLPELISPRKTRSCAPLSTYLFLCPFTPFFVDCPVCRFRSASRFPRRPL